VNKSKLIISNYKFFIIFIFLSMSFCFSYKGQLWLDTNYIDKSDNFWYFGYISELSLKGNNNFDFEWSRKLLSENHSLSSANKNENYRLWIRYTQPTYDFRIGLQKISFGSASLLRPLNWFDTIDFASTTGQTSGVKAARLQFYLLNNSLLSLWCIDDDQISCGGRIELLNQIGNFGITYFNDENNNQHEVFKVPRIIENQPSLPFPGSNHRIGLDYRYDGILGLWFEGASIMSSTKNINMNRFDVLTLGGDYTFDIFNGLLLSSESMYFSIISEESTEGTDENPWILNQTTSSLIASTPIGMLNDIMLISIKDWETKDSYSLIRWATNFDYLSINCLLSINPSPVQDSFKLMLIYNH